MGHPQPDTTEVTDKLMARGYMNGTSKHCVRYNTNLVHFTYVGNWGRQYHGIFYKISTGLTS